MAVEEWAHDQGIAAHEVSLQMRAAAALIDTKGRSRRKVMSNPGFAAVKLHPMIATEPNAYGGFFCLLNPTLVFEKGRCGPHLMAEFLRPRTLDPAPTERAPLILPWCLGVLPGSSSYTCECSDDFFSFLSRRKFRTAL